MGEFTEREVSEAETECVKLFTILDRQLKKTGAFVAGPQITIADCSIGMATHRWLNLPVKRPDLPELARYYRTLSERPAYQKTILIGMP
jgi:glutathione S-transferase